MTVTGVEEVSRSRYRVSLEDGLAFVLYKGELPLYGVREGEELSEEARRQILEELLPRRAKLRCMSLLKGRPYTEKRLREKLREGGYPDACAEAALAYVKSFGYVDDASYARDYLENQKGKKSRRAIGQELRNRGVAAEVIEEAFAALERSGEAPDEEALARGWLEKKHFSLETADRKERQRMAAFLYRKGIGSETIRSVLQDWDG